MTMTTGVNYGIVTVPDGAVASLFAIAAWASVAATARYDLLLFCPAWECLVSVFVEFSLAATTKRNDGSLSHLAGSIEVGEKFILVGHPGQSATFIGLGWITEIHDCIFCCVSEETSGSQSGDRFVGGNSFIIRFGFIVDGDEAGNLVIEFFLFLAFRGQCM